MDLFSVPRQELGERYELIRIDGDGPLTRLICGSEGTLAAVTSAVLRTVPRPTRRGLGVVFFDSIGEALAAAVELLDLEPGQLVPLLPIGLRQGAVHREPLDLAVDPVQFPLHLLGL